MFQSIKDFETRYLLTMKHFSTSRETLKLLLNIQIILSSNKIQLLQNEQFLNYIWHKLIPLTQGSRILRTQGSRILFPVFYVLSKIYALLSSQSNFCVLMISISLYSVLDTIWPIFSDFCLFCQLTCAYLRKWNNSKTCETRKILVILYEVDVR